MPFENRWRMRGTLTTRTPLHVGNGDITTRDTLVDENAAGDPKPRVEISAVATDHLQRAYIPGMTLKGNLRAWLSMNKISSSTITSVFGSEDPGANAMGGKAEFWEAFASSVPDPPPQVPYWDSRRLTGVSASVAIDRRTRTASPNKLFHEEYVPPGISFEVTVTGQDLEPDDLDLLLFALEGFNDPENPVFLGANTGDGQGRCIWKLDDIARLESKDVAVWLQQQHLLVGYDSLHPLQDAERKAMLTHALSAFQAPPHPTITLTLDIRFNGLFLVNDPSRAQQGKQKSSEDTGLPDHVPLRDHQGRVVLPARSLRGALRSQAEKIVRTLRSACNKLPEEAACLVVDTKGACQPLAKDSQPATHLCLTCQVFGAPGWRAPIEFSDFVLAPGSTEICVSQEFLAIDRFTGGGADGLKFDAVAVYQPTLTGTMAVLLDRVEPWALGLLALTLRDLMEGDIPLGFGAAKGYGACKATIGSIRVSGFDLLPKELQKMFKKNEVTPGHLNGPETTGRPPDEVACVVIDLVEALQEKVVSFHRHSEPKGDHNALP